MGLNSYACLADAAFSVIPQFVLQSLLQRLERHLLALQRPSL